MSDPTCNDKQCASFVQLPDGSWAQQTTGGGASATDTPIMQCLEDSTGTTFFATYLIDPATGQTTASPVYIDALGAPYTPVGPITKPKDPLDTEIKLFCDEGNNDEKFFKVIVLDSDGTVISTSDVDLIGAPYVPVGPESLCPQEVTQCELTEIWTCDSTDAVNGVEEKEWITNAVDNPNDISNNHDIKAGFTDVDGCGQYAHSENPDTTAIITTSVTTNQNNGDVADQHELNFYIKLDEAAELAVRIRGNSGGAVYIGPCYGKTKKVFEGSRPFGTSLPQTSSIGFYAPGIYKVRLINHDPTDNGQTGLMGDFNGNGTFNFFPSSDLYTTPPKVEKVKAWINKGEEKYFLLDGTELVETATLEIKCYDPCDNVVEEGAISDELPACELVDIWTCDYSSATAGVEEQEWEANAIVYSGSDEETLPVAAGFREIDGCGHYLHENDADVVRTRSTPDTSNIALADNVSDQHELNFYIKLDIGSELFARTSGASGSAIYAGSCAGKLQKIYDYAAPTAGPTIHSIGFFPAGVYKFRMLNHDPTASGSLGLRWDPNADGTVDRIPFDIVFQNPPIITRSKAWITKGQEGYTALDGSKIEAVDNVDITCFDPCAGADIIAQQIVPDQCELRKIWVMDTSGAFGAVEQYWEGPNALDPGNTDIETAFTLKDDCGVLQHVNAPDATNIILLDGALSTDPNTAGLNHQNRVEGYIVVPAPGKFLRLRGGGLSSRALYMAPCGQKLQPTAAFVSSGSEEIGFYAPGIYHFVHFNHDDGTNGNTRISWKDITGAWDDIPVQFIYQQPPPVIQHSVWVTKGSSIAVDIDGIDYDLREDNTYLCDPCDNNIPITTSIGANTKDAATIVGSERIVIANGNDDTLTVPNGANGAIVQVQFDDIAADQGNCARFYMDGRNATATAGFLANHKEYIYLGCAASNEATVTDAVSELSDFEIHTGELTSGLVVEVTYYAF